MSKIRHEIFLLSVKPGRNKRNFLNNKCIHLLQLGKISILRTQTNALVHTKNSLRKILVAAKMFSPPHSQDNTLTITKYLPFDNLIYAFFQS